MRPRLLLLAAACLSVAQLTAQAAEPGLAGGNVGPAVDDTSEVADSRLTGQPVGAALRALDWWEETPVQVPKLQTYEKSQEAILAGLPSNKDSLDWFVLGPIPAKSRSDYYRSYPLEERIDLTGTVIIGGTQYSWRRPHGEDKVGHGLNLRDLLKAQRGGVAYLYRDLVAEEATETHLFVGFYTGCRIWLNGEEIFFSDSSTYNDPDRIELPVRLRAGVNRLLVKSFSRSSGWTFYFHTGAVHPLKARIKGYWLLADLFPEEPDRQLEARLAAVRGLLDLRDDVSLRAAREVLAELADAGPVTNDLAATAQRLAQRAQDHGEQAQAAGAWELLLRALARATADLRSSHEPVALAGLASALGLLGDVRGAERVYRRLVGEYPAAEATAEGLWTLAEFYRREGRTWLARGYYERLLADFPESKRTKAARPALQWCRQFAGDRPRRKGSFSAAQLLSHAGRLEEAGDPAGALRLCLQALSEWPDELVRVEENRLLSVARVVREKAGSLWPTLPPAAQAELAPAADRPLTQALSGGRYSLVPELLRNFPLAPSAPEALRRWADVLIEQGELGRAGAALSTLLGQYRLARDVRAQAVARLAFCARLVHDTSLRAEARLQLAALPTGTTVTWAGAQASVSEVLDWLEPQGETAIVGLPTVERLPAQPVVMRLLPDLTGQQLLSPRWPTPGSPSPGGRC